jgi:acetyl-CoA C-acetyltransferase
MSMSDDVVIVSAARTPVGSFNGAFATMPAHDLGAIAIRAALERGGIEPARVSEVIMGQILTAAQGQNPARQASIAAGIPVESPAWGVNQLCGSGLRTVALGYQALLNGDSEIVVAGGQESMSMAPHAQYLRGGTKMGPIEFVDTMIKDGLWDAFNGYHMGNTAENVAKQYQITRQQQDEFAVASQNKAEAAQKAGKFKDEIVPVTIKSRKGDIIVSDDEYPRHGATVEAMGKLRPAFEKDGTVTAGSASTEEGRLEHRRPRPDRGQRSLCGAGLRGQQGPRLGYRQGQRQRRRHRHRPSRWRIRRARTGDPAA